MKNSLSGLMQQAQKMQENLKQAQEELAKLMVTGESGGGMVKISMNGQHQVTQVEIDPELLTEDADMLCDLIAAAFNAGVNKLSEETQNKYSGLAGGMQLPPGFKLPF